MEHNRNLSSIIESIQDDAPSSDVKQEMAGASAPTGVPAKDMQNAPGKKTGHSVLRILLILLFAGLATTGVYLLSLDTSAWLSHDRLSEPASSEVNDSQAVNARLQSIRDTQIQLQGRMDRLTAAVTDIYKIIHQQTLQNQIRPGLSDDVADTLPAVPVPESRRNSTTPRERKTTTHPSIEPDNKKTTLALPIPTHHTTDSVASSEVPESDKNTAVGESATKRTVLQHEWVVNVAYFQTQEPLLKRMEILRQAGITTEQQAVTIDGKTGYRLRIPGFASSREASAYAKNSLGKVPGIKNPWVSRR